MTRATIPPIAPPVSTKPPIPDQTWVVLLVAEASAERLNGGYSSRSEIQ